VNTTPTSEGTAFAQRSDKGNKTFSKKDKEFWKTKTCCYDCEERGHPSTHCPHKKRSDGDDKKQNQRKNNNDKSRSSKTSKASGMSKLQKKIKKSFATVETKIHELRMKKILISSVKMKLDSK
jgi:hypothetical protein